jgi:integrase
MGGHRLSPEPANRASQACQEWGKQNGTAKQRSSRAALRNLKESSDVSLEFRRVGRVFLSRTGEHFRSVRTAFTTACRHANLHDLTPHTLRHTFASRLAMAGVGLRTIQELGGRKEIRMVERYAHLSDQHKAEAIERIANSFLIDSPTLFTTLKKAVS